MRYQESKAQQQAKRAARALGTAGVLGLAFVGGTLHGRARFSETQTARAETSVASVLMQSAALSDGPAWDLPNVDHPRVDYWVDLFSTRKKDEFAKYMARSGKYSAMISRKLEERGMPQDLLYLAMIESGFNPKAYSPAAASGLWQFIGETGKRYGLDINNAVDERNDPEKATDAALTYLTELHDRFGSWYLAAAAYNTGENRVARIMREETGSEKGSDGAYYEIWNRLPRETRDYVPLMVAAARISKEPARYGFEDVEKEQPLAFDEVEVAPSSSLAAIADASGTTIAELKRLNPQLKLTRTRNDQRSTVRIPAGSETSFAANWETVSARHAALAKAEAKKKPARVASSKSYKVRRGDNLSTIARKHGVTVTALRRANGLASSRIKAGATLRIPVRG